MLQCLWLRELSEIYLNICMVFLATNTALHAYF